VWSKIMNALAGAHDVAVQMIDTSMYVCISTLPASPATEGSPWAGHEAG
jgi:hypothetical protein